ncbi:hypothetical protein [Acaricomes phytoseiuli]|uniref:hypothetical protein n=1 Tax=Acaricomes phytoseiuli TaxID=291968 RepID=UPI00036EF2C6|nr:hypothetical protein [Acaricomes phytoseiuli]
MIGQLWNLSAHMRAFLRRYMSTSILLGAIRTRGGSNGACDDAPCRAMPAAASISKNLIDNGALGWLHLIVLLCVWNALKFLWIGPVSLIHLMLIRTRERRRRLANWGA